MKIHIGVVMDPIEDINFAKDSSLALMLAAQARGWELWYMCPPDLYSENGRTWAQMYPLRVYDDSEHWFDKGERQSRPLGELDLVLMRSDPPFDMRYIYQTYLLEAAESEGVRVINRPRSLRDCNEKFYAMAFPQCLPPTLVSADIDRLRAFHAEHGDVIFKPLDGMGGAAVFRLREDEVNVAVIIEMLTQNHRTPIMAQRYIPEIAEGDKRILVIDGEPVPMALARLPAPGETRANLAAGGSCKARELTERDRWIVGQVAEDVRVRGLMFVGLDVIGDYLTEINVTSPTCLRELKKATGIDAAAMLMDALAAAVAEG